MRVLLASPESKVWSSRKHIPLGLGYLAACLREAGHEPVIFDAAVEDEPVAAVIRRAAEAGRPFGLIGISATTPLIPDAWDMAETAKKLGLPTILGGPHLTIMPLESMEKPFVDYVFQGEGEHGLVELVEALEAGREPGTIPGLFFRHNGQVVSADCSPMVEELDSLPFPAHDLFKIDRYTNLQPLTDGLDPHARSFTIVTSRGCPFQCIFCSKPVTGHTWRARSVENVIAEWRWLVHDLRATEIGLTDDIWNRDLARAKALCQALVDEGLNTVPWITVHGMKVNYGDQELYRLMKAAGCKRVGFGVESGDEYILKQVIKKGQTLDQVRDAFRWAKAAGLETMGFFIFGMPHETAETMDKTIELALELDPELANFLLAAPFPGTEMWDMLQREGHIFSQDWRDFAIHDQKARFEMGEMTAELVERKWREAYRRFYMRPGRLMKRLLSWDTWRHAPARLRDFTRFLVGSRKARA
ncbi:MAG: radical SAM protein [Chloroflexi bacterium]|nr:radical SAM protein [Chloroflexota bacterium]